MRPQVQKPDLIRAEIVEYLKRMKIPFIEPPAGLGCDLILNNPITFVELKTPGSENRLTPKEKLLRDFAGEFWVEVISVYQMADLVIERLLVHSENDEW